MNRSILLRATAAAASSSSIGGDAATVRRQHYENWGREFIRANEKRIGPEAMFRSAIEAQRQIQELTSTKWKPEAKIYTCGSMVTQGLMEWGSDIDLCCLMGNPTPDIHDQEKNVFKMWTALKAYFPKHLRRRFFNQLESRVPVVTLKDCNESKVANMRHLPVSPENDVLSRTVVLNIEDSTKVITQEDLDHLLRKEDPKREKVEKIWVTDLVDRRKRGGSSAQGKSVHIQCKTRMDACFALGFLPDGHILPKKQRDLLERNMADVRYVPEMFQYMWDLNFQGYSVKNSYLLREYLHQEEVGASADGDGGRATSSLLPGTSRSGARRHAAMAVKAWGKATGVGKGSQGLLTSYGMTLLFVYYLLATRQVQWIDPWALPHPAHMPRYPEYSPLPTAVTISSASGSSGGTSSGGPEGQLVVDPAEVGQLVHGFFNFYATQFDHKNDLVSLNFPERQHSRVLGWDVETLGPARKRAGGETENEPPENFLFCIQDPYELTWNRSTTGGLNLGRLLYANKFEGVKREFELANHSLSNKASIILQQDKVLIGVPDKDPKARLGIFTKQ